MAEGGLSVRMRLTLSCAALVVLVGSMLLAVVFLFLLRYVPEGDIYLVRWDGSVSFVPDRGDLLRAFLPPAALACLALFALGLGGGWFLAGRVLQPLEAMGEAARRAAAGSLTHRIAATGPHDEFRQVADTFDSMLGSLERSLAEHQRFAANASHELRTPLATTKALLDVAAADPDVDTDRLLDRLRSANDRAIATTEALLLIARTDATPPNLAAVDLALVVEDAAETLAPLAGARGLTLWLDTQPATAWADLRLLEPLTLNLLQNAVVHNVGTGGWVGVRTGSAHGRVSLTIENPGRRLGAEEVAELSEPFRRGRGRTRGSDHAGAGLGLAIATSVTRALAGTLTLVPREEGGLVVTVTLPSAGSLPNADSRRGAGPEP